MFRSILAAGGMVCALIALEPVAAQRPTLKSDHALRDGGISQPPGGWLDFCARMASDPACRPARRTDLEPGESVLLDSGRWAALERIHAELAKIRAGKANPQMLDGITVDYYGSPMPLNQVGNITVMDARTLSIQPWEKNMLQPIERAIINSNIGINPQNDGVIIRLFLRSSPVDSPHEPWHPLLPFNRSRGWRQIPKCLTARST